MEEAKLSLTFNLFIFKLDLEKVEEDLSKSVFYTRIVFTLFVISLLTIINYLLSFRPNVWICSYSGQVGEASTETNSGVNLDEVVFIFSSSSIRGSFLDDVSKSISNAMVSSS